jgi:glucokinase
MEQAPTLAIDIGGTRMKVGLVQAGRVLETQMIEALADQGLAKALVRVGEVFSALSVRAQDCTGIAISFPGLVDAPGRRVLSAPIDKFADATSLDLSGWAEEHWGLPLVMENDANMALLGEWKHGAGKGCGNLILVTLGTGIGTSVIMGQKPLRGVHHQAGCLGGHFVVRPHGRRCICGNIGCVETVASSWALPSIAGEDPDFAGSALAHEEKLDYEAVFRLAAQGDAVAQRLLDQSLEMWGIAVVNLIHAYDPERVIVSGGIMQSGSAILPAIADMVA